MEKTWWLVIWILGLCLTVRPVKITGRARRASGPCCSCRPPIAALLVPTAAPSATPGAHSNGLEAVYNAATFNFQAVHSCSNLQTFQLFLLLNSPRPRLPLKQSLPSQFLPTFQLYLLLNPPPPPPPNNLYPLKMMLFMSHPPAPPSLS